MCLRWFRHIMRMNKDDFVRTTYENRTEEARFRGRPLVKSISKGNNNRRKRESELVVRGLSVAKQE